MSSYEFMTKCLACNGTNLKLFCDLGVQPLANNLKKSKEEKEELFPLATNVCLDCWHSQLTIAVDRDMLYKNYLYVSGTTNTLVQEFDKVASIIDKENKCESKKVLDIACNDGSFLKAFKKYNWEVAGIDPAQNIVEMTDKELNILCDYFPSNNIKDKFAAITCFNVVAHIPNPIEFVKSCGNILEDEGTLYIQTSQKNMVTNGEFDTIYHEHHSFFTINSMQKLCENAGLWLHDVEYRPVHGISYLFKIKKYPPTNNAVENKKAEESLLYKEHTYDLFRIRVENNKKSLLEKITKSNKKVVGYGVAAKGVVRTNYFGLHHDYIVDENPLKIGMVIGGVNIPIVSQSYLAQDNEDLLIVVYAWNFIDEIANKIKRLRPNCNDEIVSANL
jgi:SAM-dependent methyltransferase